MSVNWSIGIKFDKDADKIMELYGTTDETLENLFVKQFKDRLATNFKIK